MGVLKKSYYSIVIPLENSKEEYMLIHGFTGAINIVPKYVGEFFLQNDSISDIDCSDDILNQLVRRGFITNRSLEEEMCLVQKMAKAIHLYQKQRSKTFYFLVNYDCNFRCPYCYENMISNKGKNWSQNIMTKETVDKAFECLLEIEPNRKKHNQRIILYGGEPLMEANIDIVNYIVRKGSSLEYTFGAITNGFDLDLFSDLLGDKLIQKIQITLDGDKPYHNQRRFHHKKGASFDKIISNIQLALDKNAQVVIRSNIDNNNIDSVRSLYKIFDSFGWLSNPLFKFYPAQLKDNLNNLLENKNRKISYVNSTDFENINNEFQNNMGAYSELILSALKQKKPLQLRPTYCGAQNGIYILDSCCNIYCCLESVGLCKNIIGDYKQGLKWNTNYSLWKGRNTAAISACSKCPYALICGGGCAAKIMHINMGMPYCNNFPEVFRANARRAYNQFINI